MPFIFFPQEPFIQHTRILRSIKTYISNTYVDLRHHGKKINILTFSLDPVFYI